MTKDEALKLALDWFKCYADKSMSRNNAEALADDVVDAIKEALAPMSTTCEVQPAQEPVAWITPDGEGFRIRFSPPKQQQSCDKREWIGLTDEQKKHAEATCMKHGLDAAIYYVQIKLKELNK